MLTAEITNTVYERFITLNQGFSVDNNGAWLLLLNKVMGMVAELKHAELTRENRIDLVVAVVIRYLDEKTYLPDEQLQHITTSVRAMCLAMLGYGGELAGKQPTVRAPTDPELVSAPLQITLLLMDKMRELIRREPNSTQNLGVFLPQIVMLCITTVNKFRNLTNLEKRNLVVAVIHTFLDEYLAPRLTTPAQQLSLELFKADLGNMVDLFVGIAKGKPEYNFNYHDPQGRRNLLSCVGTAIVRAGAVLGLCFTRDCTPDQTLVSQNTTNQPTDTTDPTNTNNITTHTNTTLMEINLDEPSGVNDSISCNDLPSILEETNSEHDEIIYPRTNTPEKEAKLNVADLSYQSNTNINSTTNETRHGRNSVGLVQKIMDTV
jgi:hypothetical protein